MDKRTKDYLSFAKSLNEINARIDRTEAAERRLARRKSFIRVSIAGMAVVSAVVVMIFRYSPDHGDYYSWFNDESAKMKIHLPDGSTAWLGQGSTLVASRSFSSVSRNLRLDGECSFDVKSDAAHPFVVDAGPVKVEAKGTYFNLNAFRDGNKAEAVLLEGVISIVNRRGTELITLHPDQKATYYYDTRTVEASDIPDGTSLNYRYGLITITEAHITDIIRKIEAAYGVEIMPSETIRDGGTYTFSIREDTSLEDALKVVQALTGVELILK